MRVLIINKFLYPNGGSETYIFKLGEALEQHGHEVQYFGMEHEGRCVGNRVNAYTSGMDFHGGSKLSKLTYPIKTIYSKEIVYCAEKLYYYYCRENSVTNQSFSERWFDSLYFADRIYEELKGRNNLEVFARYQLLIAYYTVLRRMYPFRDQYKKEYQLVIDKIKSTSVILHIIQMLKKVDS